MAPELNPVWLKPGVSRRCQGNKYCCSEGPSYGVPILCVGTPDSHVLGECRLCATYYCGECAKREVVSLRTDMGEFRAWRLGCRRCGSRISTGEEGRFVIHSRSLGAIAGFDKRDGWALIGDYAGQSAASAVTGAVNFHRERGMRELAVFNADPPSDRMILVAERAVSEAPGEGLAWLYVALLNQKAGYSIAARRAAKEYVRLAPACPAVMEIVGIPAPAELGATVIGELVKYQRRLDHYGVKLSARKLRTFNEHLARYDATVQSSRRQESSFGSYVRSLFKDKREVPPAIRDYLDALKCEEDLDVRGVEQERASVLAVLIARLNKDEKQNLISNMIAYRLGSVSHNDFYALVEDIIADRKVDLSAWRHFRGYLRYVALARAFNNTLIHGAVWDAEQAQYASYCQTSQERDLLIQADQVYLLTRLFAYLDGSLQAMRDYGNVAPDPTAIGEFQEKMKRVAQNLRYEHAQGTKPSWWKRTMVYVTRCFGGRSNTRPQSPP